ncbi:hypothetical protein OG933_44660 [Streptomyces sp. NBC_00016]|uniref:hypothetical protein n=1 Tax=Streptomyces sp. NBC_00016 TaxID=2975622 RepID=UPI00324670DF
MTRSRLYGPDRDPVARHVGEPWIDRALRKVLKPNEIRLLTDCLWGAPPDQVGRRLGIREDDVLRLVSALLHRIKTSPYGPALLEELRSGSGPRFSELLWEGRKEVPVHRCARTGCTEPPFTQRATGRARRFCSNRCKQAAYRERRNTEQTPSTAATRHRPRTEAQRRGYLLRQYDELPELPAPRREQGWFFTYIQRRIRYAAMRPALPALAVSRAKPLPYSFRSAGRFGLPPLFFDTASYSMDTTARRRLRELYRWFNDRQAAYRLGATAPARRQPRVKPEGSLTSPMQALMEHTLDQLPPPRVYLPDAARAGRFEAPPASGPPPPPWHTRTTLQGQTTRAPAKRRRRRRGR